MRCQGSRPNHAEPFEQLLIRMSCGQPSPTFRPPASPNACQTPTPADLFRGQQGLPVQSKVLLAFGQLLGQVDHNGWVLVTAELRRLLASALRLPAIDTKRTGSVV